MFMCHLGMYAIFAPVSGYFSDRYPRHRFFIIGAGLFIFAIGHIVVGPSPLFGSLLTKYDSQILVDQDQDDHRFWLSDFWIFQPSFSTLAVNIIGLILIGFGSAFALVPTFPALIACAMWVLKYCISTCNCLEVSLDPTRVHSFTSFLIFSFIFYDIETRDFLTTLERTPWQEACGIRFVPWGESAILISSCPI